MKSPQSCIGSNKEATITFYHYVTNFKKEEEGYEIGERFSRDFPETVMFYFLKRYLKQNSSTE